MHGCCHISFPKSCYDGKHTLLVSLVGRVFKFDPDHLCEVGRLYVAISLGDAWGISRIRLQGQSVLALILSPRAVPNVSAYRPDYLFQTVIGVLGGHPSKSRTELQFAKFQNILTSAF